MLVGGANEALILAIIEISDRKILVSVSVKILVSVSVEILVSVLISVSVSFILSVSAEISVQKRTESRN